jgi:hypothetical protein
MILLKIFRRDCYSELKKRLYREENRACKVGYIMLMARIADGRPELKTKILRKVELDCISRRCDFSMLLYATCMAEWFWKKLDASLCLALPLLYAFGRIKLDLVGLGTQNPKAVVMIDNSVVECDIPPQCTPL